MKATSVNVHASARVVLVHGLWLNGLAMLPLSWRLSRCGFEAVRFSYATVGESLEHNADTLARFCREQGTEPLHLVGHSLGGLLILAALDRNDDLKVRRVLLMAVLTQARPRPSVWQIRFRQRCLAGHERRANAETIDSEWSGSRVSAGNVPWAGPTGGSPAESARWRGAGGRNPRAAVKDSIVLRITTPDAVLPAVARAACALPAQREMRHA